MRNVLGLLAVVLLASCGSNTPPLPPRPLPVVAQDSVKTDSIPTIVLSDTTEVPFVKDININVNVSDTLTSINAEDGTSFVRFDGTKDITTILIKVDKKHKKIKQVQINGSDLLHFGDELETHDVPMKMISKDKVLILRGASLNLVSRYYDVSMTQLMWCNDIDNKNYIQAGTILKLNCNEK